MSGYLSVAGILTILLGLIHSVLGEWLIFHKLRDKHNWQWINTSSILPLRSIRILWASWHVVTILAFAIGIILLGLDSESGHSLIAKSIKITLLISIFCCAVLVLVATKARHPGWFVLLVIAVLIYANLSY